MLLCNMSARALLFEFIEAKLFAYKLPFKVAMQFKQYQLFHREGLILQLTDKNGDHHFTEIAPLPGFSHETLAQVKVQIIELLASTSSRKAFDFTAYVGDYPSIQFALDSLLFSVNNTIQRQNTEIRIDNVALLQGNLALITAQYQQLGKPNLIKLKVARESVDIDINNFQQLCLLNSKLKIRCDANQAWSKQQAAQFFSAINVEQLDYIEEPTSDHQSNLQLADKFLINLALDETLQHPDFDYQHHQSISAFIIKPSLIGSKTKIDKLLSTAKKLGIKVNFSSSFESIIGLQQLKKLAASYLSEAPEQNLVLSLGIDTLKYFNDTLLQDENKIEQECQQLELLWTSYK